MSYLDWHVGMKVVCVFDGYDPVPPTPVFGVVYTISWIGHVRDFVAVDLVELPNPEDEVYGRGYYASIFRPVQTRKTDISIFERMLTPSKASERA